ncbi:MAG: hypothetical protein GY777_10135 [Candidatus Brocadiaceae bacterium]|nr:hypothetical protein [Candidatus Brocadiaceae bacterium]
MKIAGTSIKLKNAAPGACFALFGVIIISIMFINGGPELTMKTIENAVKVDQTELKLRGDGNDALSLATKEGLLCEEGKDTIKAIAAYEKALSLMADPMNNIAWLYLEQGRIEDSLSLSQIAVQLTPNNANHLDTRTEVLLKSGEYAEALKVMDG